MRKPIIPFNTLPSVVVCRIMKGMDYVAFMRMRLTNHAVHDLVEKRRDKLPVRHIHSNIMIGPEAMWASPASRDGTHKCSEQYEFIEPQELLGAHAMELYIDAYILQVHDITFNDLFASIYNGAISCFHLTVRNAKTPLLMQILDKLEGMEIMDYWGRIGEYVTDKMHRIRSLDVTGEFEMCPMPQFLAHRALINTTNIDLRECFVNISLLQPRCKELNVDFAGTLTGDFCKLVKSLHYGQCDPWFVRIRHPNENVQKLSNLVAQLRLTIPIGELWTNETHFKSSFSHVNLRPNHKNKDAMYFRLVKTGEENAVFCIKFQPKGGYIQKFWNYEQCLNFVKSELT